MHWNYLQWKIWDLHYDNENYKINLKAVAWWNCFHFRWHRSTEIVKQMCTSPKQAMLSANTSKCLRIRWKIMIVLVEVSWRITVIQDKRVEQIMVEFRAWFWKNIFFFLKKSTWSSVNSSHSFAPRDIKIHWWRSSIGMEVRGIEYWCKQQKLFWSSSKLT